MEEINKQALNVVQSMEKIEASDLSLNEWSKDRSEGYFNYSHIDSENIYVLDEMLYENIELCDLLIEDPDNNKIYFIHNKKGIDGNMRMLVNQIEHGLRFLSGFSQDFNILVDYYASIVNKIRNTSKETGEETQLSKAARKFKERFQRQDDFID